MSRKQTGSKQSKAKTKKSEQPAAGVPMRIEVVELDDGEKDIPAVYKVSTMLAGERVSYTGTGSRCMGFAKRTKGLEPLTVGALRIALRKAKAEALEAHKAVEAIEAIEAIEAAEATEGASAEAAEEETVVVPASVPFTVTAMKVGKTISDSEFHVKAESIGSYAGDWERVLEWGAAVNGLDIGTADLEKALADAREMDHPTKSIFRNEIDLPAAKISVAVMGDTLDKTTFKAEVNDETIKDTAKVIRRWARTNGIQTPSMAEFRAAWDNSPDKPEPPTLAPPKARKSAAKHTSYKERAAEQPVGDLPTKDQLKVVYDEVQSNTKPRAEGGGWLSFNGSGRSTGDRSKLWGKISFGVGFGPSDLEAAYKAAAKLKRKWSACEAEVYQTRPSKQYGSYPCIRLRYAG